MSTLASNSLTMLIWFQESSANESEDSLDSTSSSGEENIANANYADSDMVSIVHISYQIELLELVIMQFFFLL